MGMTGMEAVLTAVETTLSSNMAAKVAALNASYADGITLAPIATYEWYMKNFAAQEYPVCVLDPVTSIPEERYIGAMTEQHRIIVFVADTDSNAETLIKRLFRHARAVREILTTNHTLGGVSHSVSVISTSYSPTFGDKKESRYLRTVAVEIEVYKEEIA